MDILFPSKVIPTLRNLRGPLWDDLIERVNTQPSTAIDKMAFILMMVRIVGCVECNLDSIRAMRGCKVCAQQTLRRFQGSDQDLMVLYHQAKQDIENYYSKG